MSKKQDLEIDNDIDGFHHSGATISEPKPKPRHRPWQLQFVGFWPEESLDAIIPEVELILESMPGVPVLTLHFENEQSVTVTRDFPGDYLSAVDAALERIFQNEPRVSGITFPRNEHRAEHTATPEDPFWSVFGKPAAQIHARMVAEEITPDQAGDQFRELWTSKVES